MYDLYAEGCHDIISEVYGSSLRMSRAAYEALGVSHEAAEQMKDIFQRNDHDAMHTVAKAYRVDVPSHKNQEYIASFRSV